MSAVIDGEYRYELRRGWGTDAEPKICWVMLNPSTADATKDDPTVRLCRGFSNRWGFGSMVIVNLFAFRSPHPKVLVAHSSPIGPHNDAAILGAATEADRVMAAWGVHGAHLTRGAKVTQMLTSAGFELWCLGTTKSGAPRHPRFVVPEAPIHRYR